jgi:hypothetical protein
MRRRIRVCHMRRSIPVHHGRDAGEGEGGLGDGGSKYHSPLSARVREHSARLLVKRQRWQKF